MKATTISTVEQMTSQSRWTPRLFLLKKKKKFEVTTEKKKGKEKVRGKMNEKKENKKKATTTNTTRKFAEKTFKVNKCMTSATEILPPRERRRKKRS